mgnify:CR=1 FL=1|jgi:hypothetical protein
MSIYNYRAGLGNTASYQSSGAPFVTGSDTLNGVMKVTFPSVTKQVSVYVEQAKSVDFYFNENATTLNKFSVGPSTSGPETFTIDVKCKEIYIETGVSTKVRVYASLTGIATVQMYALTGSGITK